MQSSPSQPRASADSSTKDLMIDQHEEIRQRLERIEKAILLLSEGPDVSIKSSPKQRLRKHALSIAGKVGVKMFHAMLKDMPMELQVRYA